MSDDSYTAQGSSWRYRAAIGLLLVLVLLIVAAWRGGSSGNTALDQNEETDEGSERDELERQLSTILDGLRPERLAVSVDASGIVDSMNLWWADYTRARDVQLTASATEALQNAYGVPASEYAVARRFDARDMSHIRNCLMYRDIVEEIAETSDTDIERAVAAFQFVIDNVELAPGSSAGPPVTAFEVPEPG